MGQRKFSFLTKIVLFQFIFLGLHYLYEWIPSGLTAIFSGIDESLYQHTKIAFFAYIFTILIEFLWTRPAQSSLKRMLAARLLTCIFLPWMVIIYFLLSPLLFEKITSIPLEIIFANAALVLSSSTALMLEGYVEQSEPGTGALILLAALFLISLAHYIVFTQRLPWFDIFARPPGW